MTVNAIDFGRLLEGKFNVAAFQESMSASSVASVSQEQGQQIQVGQMKSEPETAAAIDNLANQTAPGAENLNGLDSIRKGLEEKAAQIENSALAASNPKDAAAMEAELEDRAAAALVPKNSKTPELDKGINKMLGLKGNVAGIEMLADMPKFEVASCDQNSIECSTGGGKERSTEIQR